MSLSPARVACAALLCCPLLAHASAHDLFEQVRPAVVAVRYTWAFELGPREMSVVGLVVGKDGLVMTTAGAFDDAVALEQIKDVKVIVPRLDQEPLELPAEFQGRDDRTHLAYIKVADASDLKPLTFDASLPAIGDKIYSIGLMPKAAGYRPYFRKAMVSTLYPGERNQFLVDGGLSGVGSVVLSEAGRAIGFVDTQPVNPASEGDRSRQPSSPTVFTSAADFAASLTTPPAPGQPVRTTWLGVMDLAPLKKDTAEFYGLSTPALQVGTIVPGGSADKAGLKAGDLIVRLDGKPLESADTPEQTAARFRRQISDAMPGSTVKFGLLAAKGEPVRDVAVTLQQSPVTANAMPRFWADDLGFGVRELTSTDRLVQHVDPTAGGLMVTVVKPAGAAAASTLRSGSVIVRLNEQAVTNIADFVKTYQSLRESRPQDAVVLLVRREGQEETLRVEPAK